MKKTNILVIDNYDSFVFNIIHILKQFENVNIDLVKNDEIPLNQLANYDKILLSPGPGIPEEAGQLMEVFNHLLPSHAVLGICLGHQAIACYYQEELKNLEEPLHGVASEVEIIAKDILFENTPKKFKIGHYHSWVVDHLKTDALEVLAYDSKQNIMALRHKQQNIKGLQFHPESILTEFGIEILKSWVEEVKN